jgi:hypothetical protein
VELKDKLFYEDGSPKFLSITGGSLKGERP